MGRTPLLSETDEGACCEAQSFVQTENQETLIRDSVHYSLSLYFLPVGEVPTNALG